MFFFNLKIMSLCVGLFTIILIYNGFNWEYAFLKSFYQIFNDERLYLNDFLLNL